MSQKQTQTQLVQSFEPHDHEQCRQTALAKAKALCSARHLRLTPTRQRVLEILWESHRPIGAYDILEQLKADGLGTHPPTAYRALEFLVLNGLAHKLKAANAFIGCAHPGVSHTPYFMICSECSEIREFFDDKIAKSLEATLQDAEFTLKGINIEIEGYCKPCAHKIKNKEI